MALENVQEQINLSGESRVDGQVVAAFTCRVGENGIAGSVGMVIRNHDLYQEHRNTVRQDQQDFQAKVWEIEDRMAESD